MNNKTTSLIHKDLTKALYRFSYGGLSSAECERIAAEDAPNLDFSTPGLSHKGVNWCAKQIIAHLIKAQNQ